MKAWTIAWKDTLIRFRDRNALLLMLVAPLVVSSIIGAAFGSFTDSDETPFRDIPVVIVNQDQGEWGQVFVDIAESDDLDDLLEPTLMADLDRARAVVGLGETRAVLFIPPDFSEALEEHDPDGPSVRIQLYTDPAANVTPNIIRNIVDRIAGAFNRAVISRHVSVEQILDHSDDLGAALAELESALSDELAARFTPERATPHVDVRLITITEGKDAGFNPLGFFAPSMAIFFLTFTMFDGTRSILVEQQEGTLPRLISTPTSASQILMGKIGGVFLTGLLQFSVLVVASRLIFDLYWGDSPVGLLLLVVAIVAATTSIGALVAALSRNITQANIIGTAVTLVFAALGGNFFPAQNYPRWLQAFSWLTVNRWGLEGFSDLTLRGLGIREILLEVGVLSVLAVITFLVATWRFRRRLMMN